MGRLTSSSNPPNSDFHRFRIPQAVTIFLSSATLGSSPDGAAAEEEEGLDEVAEDDLAVDDWEVSSAGGQSMLAVPVSGPASLELTFLVLVWATFFLISFFFFCGGSSIRLDPELGSD